MTERSDEWMSGYHAGRQDAARDVARMPFKVVYVAGDYNQRLVNRDEAADAARGAT